MTIRQVQNPQPKELVAFAAVAALFFLNDFAFMAAEDVGQWLAADYAFKIAALALIVFVLPLRRAAADRALVVSTTEAVLMGLVAAAFVVTVFELGYRPLDEYFADTQLQEFPEISSPALYWLDMTAGLALTAIAEELVFRRLFFSVLGSYFSSTAVLVIASAVLFGLIHWSGGVANVVAAMVAGVALMLLMLRCGSVWPAIAAHYLANFILFYDPLGG